MPEPTVTATSTPPGETPPEAPKTEAKPESVETAAKPAEAKPEEKPAAKPEPKFYERKVNGKVEKIPAEAIDAAAAALGMSPSEMLSTSQLKRAAYERFEAAEKARKEVEALKGIKDPWALAQKMAGLDDAALDAAAEERLIKKLQREAMDPAQRALAEERDKLAKERAAIEEQKKAQAETVLSQQAQAVRAKLEPAIIEAVEKAGLPRTPDAVRAVVNELERQHKYGLPLDPAQAAIEAREQFFRPSLGILRSMPAEALIRELGKEKYEELLRYSIAKKPETTKTKPAEPAKPAAPERAYITEKEFKAKYG